MPDGKLDVPNGSKAQPALAMDVARIGKRDWLVEELDLFNLGKISSL